jgi:hypothetical protein
MLRWLIITIIYLGCFKLTCSCDSIDFCLQCYHISFTVLILDVSQLQGLEGMGAKKCYCWLHDWRAEEQEKAELLFAKLTDPMAQATRSPPEDRPNPSARLLPCAPLIPIDAQPSRPPIAPCRPPSACVTSFSETSPTTESTPPLSLSHQVEHGDAAAAFVSLLPCSTTSSSDYYEQIASSGSVLFLRLLSRSKRALVAHMHTWLLFVVFLCIDEWMCRH